MPSTAANHPTDLLITARIAIEGEQTLEGELILPALVRGVVVFAHGSAAAGIARAIGASASSCAAGEWFDRHWSPRRIAA